MSHRRHGYSNLRIGKYRRKKLVDHYSVPFFLAVAFRTNSRRGIVYVQLIYDKIMRARKLEKDYLIDEVELIFAL